jgi:hypothetical protein
MQVRVVPWFCRSAPNRFESRWGRDFSPTISRNSLGGSKPGSEASKVTVENLPLAAQNEPRMPNKASPD